MNAAWSHQLDEWMLAKRVSASLGETFETSWSLGRARVNHAFAEGVEYA